MSGLQKCQLCNSTQKSTFEDIRDGGEYVKFVSCDNCGLVCQWPMPTASELEYFNNHLYRRNVDIDDLEKHERRRAEAQFQLLLEDFIPGRFLDIGCSTGQLLLREREYWPLSLSMHGVEPIRQLADRARSNGVPNLYRNVYEIATGIRFDMITMSHSLEHMLRPGIILYGLRRLAHEFTRLYVEVPNLFGDIALEKAHLFAFSENTLVSMLENSGWELFWVKKFGAPKHPWMECYLGALARPKPSFELGPIPSPGGIFRKRKIGMLKRMLALATYGGENRC